MQGSAKPAATYYAVRLSEKKLLKSVVVIIFGSCSFSLPFIFLQNLSLYFSEWVEEADKQKSGGLCDAQKQYHRPHFKYSFYNAEAQVQ
jgi:hypothetical protein